MNNDSSSPKPDLKYGAVVNVRDGFHDPDLDIDMSGWHGRVRQVYQNEGTALIAFDSLTLLELPESYIDNCEEEGYSWSRYGYDLADLIKTVRRDVLSDVQEVLREMRNRYRYRFLGQEGPEVNQIFWAIDPDGSMDPLDVWEAHMKENLKFPFEAMVDEWQDRGPLRPGDKMHALDIGLVDESYGLLIEARRSRKKFLFPLCDLAAVDKNSPQYDLIQRYRVWFANI